MYLAVENILIIKFLSSENYNLLPNRLKWDTSTIFVKYSWLGTYSLKSKFVRLLINKKILLTTHCTTFGFVFIQQTRQRKLKTKNEDTLFNSTFCLAPCLYTIYLVLSFDIIITLYLYRKYFEILKDSYLCCRVLVVCGAKQLTFQSVVPCRLQIAIENLPKFALTTRIAPCRPGPSLPSHVSILLASIMSFFRCSEWMQDIMYAEYKHKIYIQISNLFLIQNVQLFALIRLDIQY